MNDDPNDHDVIPSVEADGKAQPSYMPEAIADDTFSYAGFQVVRGEYFAHTFEPSITFNDYRIYVSKSCLKRLPDVEYVQALVNPSEKKLVIRPSEESEKGAFLWLSKGKSGRNPKQITCRIFFAMIMQLMGWNPGYRYKLLGKLIVSKSELLFVFDLTEPEIYQRLLRDPETKMIIKPGSKKPVYPEEWKDQFGLPVEENSKSLKINIYNQYAVYGITERKGTEMPVYAPSAEKECRDEKHLPQPPAHYD